MINPENLFDLLHDRLDTDETWVLSCLWFPHAQLHPEPLLHNNSNPVNKFISFAGFRWQCVS
jgi:hypothetical protein